MIKRRITLSVVTAATLLLTACSADAETDVTSSEAEASTVSVSLPPQDRAAWVMPLDPYILTMGQVRRESYLHALISQRCISERGYSHTVPAPDLSDNTTLLGRRNTFSAATAAASGYAPANAVEQKANDAWAAYTQRTMSQEELTALDGCVRQLMNDESVPKWEPRILEYAANMSSAAIIGAAEDPAVHDAADRWAECVRPLGIEDLPTSPSFMPTKSMLSRYGVAEGTAFDAQRVVTSSEKSDALADAKCREDSGYTAALYDAEWDRQADLLRANYDSFVSLRSEVEQLDRKMIEQVALLAPAQ